MARRFTLAALLIFLGVGQVAACSMKGLDPNDFVENTPVYSANGRFCVVVRWNEGIADFSSQWPARISTWTTPNTPFPNRARR